MRSWTCILAALLAGCTTVSDPGPQTIHVASNPSGAAVQVDCGAGLVAAGLTPADVAVNRSAKRCVIAVSKAGYAVKSVQLTRVRIGRSSRFASGPIGGNVYPTGSEGGVILSRSTEDAYQQVPEAIEVTLDPLTASHPDLSGSWTIDKTATKLQRLEIANLDRATVDIRQTADMLRFSRTLVVRGREDTFNYDLPLDGREITSEAAGQTLHARLFWEGSDLVYSTRIVERGGESVNVVHYSLSADGNVLTAAERRRGILNYDNLWVFTRVR